LFLNLQDVQHADIDYMIGNRDFTVDPIHYNGTYKYFKELQNEGMKIILILVIFLNYIYNLRLNI
jgi:hypothetical protein